MLRVATFNIRNGRAHDGLQSWPFRWRLTVRAIAALDADVVGLQEVFAFQRRTIMRGLPGHHSVGRGREADGSGEQCPVVARTRSARIVETRTRWFGATPDVPGTRLPNAMFPRTATVCVVEVPGWRSRVQIANVHLDAHDEGRRAESVEQLVSFVDLAAPCVLLGDFNTGPDSTTLAPIAAAGFRSALPAGAGGTEHEFTGRTDGDRIDHVFVNASVAVRAATVRTDLRRGRRLPSDHWPVTADLTPA